MDLNHNIHNKRGLKSQQSTSNKDLKRKLGLIWWDEDDAADVDDEEMKMSGDWRKWGDWEIIKVWRGIEDNKCESVCKEKKGYFANAPHIMGIIWDCTPFFKNFEIAPHH